MYLASKSKIFFLKSQRS